MRGTLSSESPSSAGPSREYAGDRAGIVVSWHPKEGLRIFPKIVQISVDTVETHNKKETHAHRKAKIR